MPSSHSGVAGHDALRGLSHRSYISDHNKSKTLPVRFLAAASLNNRSVISPEDPNNNVTKFKLDKAPVGATSFFTFVFDGYSRCNFRVAHSV